MMYTSSDAFFEALWDAGVTFCFLNLGSDHPSIIEAFVRGQRERPKAFPQLITCPHEMVSLAMADGFARLSGKPQCVIVHVDVGTQNLGAAMHDAHVGRSPVLLFAGLSPFTLEGEMRGSRTEYIHWVQDVNSQPEILRQYCRFTGEVKTGKNIKQMLNRALSFAMSAPKGPAYLVGAREIMEQEIEPYYLKQDFWRPVEPTALPSNAVKEIAESLFDAKDSLIITGHSGRNHRNPGQLVKLADSIPGLKVLDTAISDMCFPATHPAWQGARYGDHASIRTADVILVIDCDVPWIPTKCSPKESAKIFHIDEDPLKRSIPVFYINAIARYQADSYTSLSQLNEFVRESPRMQTQIAQGVGFQERLEARRKSYESRMSEIKSMAVPAPDDSYDVSYLIAQVRKACPRDTIWVVEAVTSTHAVSDQLQASIPGSYINCGGGGLGWSGGAALGIKLASMSEDWLKQRAANGSTDSEKPTFVCQIVGDGTYMYTVPSSVYWISNRYNIPILTIVLNNLGWNAPKNSLLLVHPDGDASQASNADLKISFAPTPDYGGIAKAAAGGNVWAGRASKAEELHLSLEAAVKAVKGGQSAVLDAQLNGSEGKYAEK